MMLFLLELAIFRALDRGAGQSDLKVVEMHCGRWCGISELR